MLALSVRQPWAWAIARGHKVIENRDWDTRFRGTLAIHASLRVDLDSSERPTIRAAGWDPGDPVAAIGGIVAVVRLVGVCAAARPGPAWPEARPGPGSGPGCAGPEPFGVCGCGAWANPGEFHWQLGDPRPLPRPVMAVGEAGMWELPPAVAAEVTRLARHAGGCGRRDDEVSSRPGAPCAPRQGRNTLGGLPLVGQGPG
jgi:ASCH domain